MQQIKKILKIKSTFIVLQNAFHCFKHKHKKPLDNYLFIFKFIQVQVFKTQKKNNFKILTKVCNDIEKFVRLYNNFL